LTVLSLSNNNFSEEQNLGYFSKFTNLEELYLGTDKKERIKKILYNKFTGSLKNLEALTKLEKLQIEATDVDDGLECLSESLERIVH
jgi:Leucine-rich repeat (LRR) protein